MGLVFSTSATAQDTFQSLLSDRKADGPAAVLYASSAGETFEASAGTLKQQGRPAKSDDKFYVASVSKTYLATAILQLHETGRLNVTDPAARYLPITVVTGFGGMRDITIADLLRMQSGLRDYLTDEFEQDVQANPSGPWPPEKVLSYAYGIPTNHLVGTGFDYSNTNYVLLQLILESVAEQPMHQYLETYVLKPAGAGSAYVHGTRARAENAVHGYEDLRGDGIEDVSWYYQTPLLGDGFLVTSAQEIAYFYRALLIEKTLLRDEALALMFEDNEHEGYGMGIETEEDPELGMIAGHSGGDNGFSAHAYYLQDFDLIIVSLRADDSSDASILYRAVDILAD